MQYDYNPTERDPRDPLRCNTTPVVVVCAVILPDKGTSCAGIVAAGKKSPREGLGKIDGPSIHFCVFAHSKESPMLGLRKN